MPMSLWGDPSGELIGAASVFAVSHQFCTSRGESIGGLSCSAQSR